ncbi:ACP S-malonyltransferase, partial [Enterococcus faecalis]|nr:ACP S-malonyltransferase [Enterococcus faecalis]
VTPANYNTPQQIVIGGEAPAVDKAVELLQAAGTKRVIPLNVSGPFHTALLEPASQQLAQELAQITFDELQIPVISNTTAQPMQQD